MTPWLDYEFTILLWEVVVWFSLTWHLQPLFSAFFPWSDCIIVWSMYVCGKISSNHLMRIILCFFLWCMCTIIVRFHNHDMKFFDALYVKSQSLHSFRTYLTRKHQKIHHIHIMRPLYLYIFTILNVLSIVIS